MIKQEGRIWWCEIWLNKDVHMIGLGFTKLFYKYAYAAAASEAEANVHAWATASGCDVLKVKVDRVAVLQDIKTYTFPDSILDLPEHLLQAEFERRQYPESLRNPGQKSPRQEVSHA